MAATLVGDEPANTEIVTYAPGQLRTWTAAAGLHTVLVVSGSLSVSDRACPGIVYSAGEAFAGGWADYSVVNHGHRPTVVIVTYMSGTDARPNESAAPRSYDQRVTAPRG